MLCGHLLLVVMRKSLTYIALLWIFAPLIAQNGYGNILVTGTKIWQNAAFAGGNQLEFSDTSISVSEFDMNIHLYDIACISDKHGQLVAYTSGCSIMAKNHHVMTNGSNINEGGIYNLYCDEGDYPSERGLLFLPWPDDSMKYVLVHVWDDEASYTSTKLMYSLVNMDTPNNLGEVTAKNQVIFEDVFASQICAVRHANGRDWWIIAPRFNTNTYFLFLLSPTGFSGPFVKEFGNPMFMGSGFGQSNFSADGTKYIRSTPLSHLMITDFNRCDGKIGRAHV